MSSHHHYHNMLGMKAVEQGGPGGINVMSLPQHDQHYFRYTQPTTVPGPITQISAPATTSHSSNGPGVLGKHALNVNSHDDDGTQVQSKQAKLESFGRIALPSKEEQRNQNPDISEEEADNSEEEDDEEEEPSPDGENKENENDMLHSQTVTPNTSFVMHPLAHSTPFLPSSPATNFMAAAHWNALNLKTEQLAAHYFNTAYAMANQHQDFVQIKQENHQGYPATPTYPPNLAFSNSLGSSSSGFHSSSSNGESTGMPSLFGGSMVTMGEVQRRISPPECLNASILGGILRKAKNKDGGKVLRDALKQHGLTLPSGRRKSSATTSFTSLVEEEAMQLAKDLSDISNQNYPFKAAAKYALQSVTATPTEIQQFKLELFYARKFVQRINEFHQADRSPLADQRSPSEMVLDPELQKGLTNFSMLTHGFGGEAIRAALNVLNNCITECGEMLDAQNNGKSTAHS
uniref:Transcription factor AP-2 C-terminal domain-containing protein n=1 Tax=Ditylenchus dipsaci TaxID=166011 RepID=A0A915EFJ4_9BILA